MLKPRPSVPLRFRLLNAAGNSSREIYDHYELHWSGEFEQRLAVYVRDNPTGRHGPHRYPANEFGQTNGQIAERFAAYRQELGFAR